MAFLKAILFGSIGTLTETSELQRKAFNQAFADAGLDIIWDAAAYREKVSGAQGVVGGSNRIRADAAARGFTLDDAAITRLHDAKSRIFQDMMTRDGLPLNRGVAALIADARHHDLAIGFASTTSRANVDAMLAATRPPVTGQFDLILSGDDVAAAKPSPDIYLKALDRLHMAACDVIAIEDSAPSMAAALAAGIATVVVPGKLWAGGTFDGASAVLPDLDGITAQQLGARAGRTPVAA